MATPERYVGKGWESQFAVNHLGHFVLVNKLWGVIKNSGRIVSVSSAGHHHSDIRWQDISFNTGYDKWIAYGQSKTANALFAVHLNRLGEKRGIQAYSVHPGKIFTPLQRYLSQAEMTQAGWLDEQGRPADPTFKSPAQGAATHVWAATSELLNDRGGVYCEDCEVAPVDDGDVPSFVGVRPYAADPEHAERLWRLSAELTGIDIIRRPAVGFPK
ncbi:short subunit dehydrogenase [Phyllobacterium leguminum]|uniref:Short subunit dehydrogenase n=1 Tax=Phyllobacterium leguminum TaxID=314237 RepID=A0A318SZE7_9HYPH|nr:short subunit dehydrogenase [Phyllobacterium leguminum]